MIRTGIIGGSNPMAGELMRLLVNHPDVEVMWINSNHYPGRLVSDLHHGLLGETDLRFSPTADLDKINLLFIFRHKGQTIEWLRDRMIPESLRIIDLSVDMQDPETAREHDFVYGLPELNRKVMVRGARRAIVPHPIASLCTLALLPLAKDEDIEGDIEARVYVPNLGQSPERTNEEIAEEVAFGVRELHPTFNRQIKLSTEPGDTDRAISATVTLPSTRDIGRLIRDYEEYYGDHNFVFMLNNTLPEAKEVEGTNKCLIHVDKTGGNLVVTAMMDSLIKGAAGTAVHDMNLLFGLMERTGLALKASTF